MQTNTIKYVKLKF